MAVAVEQKPRAAQAADYPVGCVGGKPVGEQPDLRAQSFRAIIVREELQHLVAEDAGAAWLEKDEGKAGVDLRRDTVEDVDQVTLC